MKSINCGFLQCRFNNFAICCIAAIVSLPACNEGTVEGGEVFNNDTISLIDCRKKSSVVTFGMGILCGKNATVSLLRSDDVSGIKHFTHL